jgi:hypothetical protein
MPQELGEREFIGGLYGGQGQRGREQGAGSGEQRAGGRPANLRPAPNLCRRDRPAYWGRGRFDAIDSVGPVAKRR